MSNSIYKKLCIGIVAGFVLGVLASAAFIYLFPYTGSQKAYTEALAYALEMMWIIIIGSPRGVIDMGTTILPTCIRGNENDCLLVARFLIPWFCLFASIFSMRRALHNSSDFLVVITALLVFIWSLGISIFGYVLSFITG